MKTIMRPFVFLVIVILMAVGCTKDPSGWYGPVEGYVTGAFRFYRDNSQYRLTPVGYSILLSGSNTKDRIYPLDFYTYDLPYRMVKYPVKISSDYYDGTNCPGAVFFPDTLLFKFKIGFRYKVLNEKNKTKTRGVLCFASGPVFPWGNYKEIVLIDVIKIDN